MGAKRSTVTILWSLMLVTLIQAGPDDIYLENGGYKGILVAIGDNVPYSPDILPNMREVFVEASKALYKATEYDIRNSGNPAEGLTSAKHFAQIKVLVPKSWPPVTGCNGSISELYGNADFRVTVGSPQWGDLLYTQMITSECREPGQYTTLPETFLKDLNSAKELYGEDLGKAVLHEWAQLRWGIREESNFKNGGETCRVLEDWNLYRYRQPIRCSLAVKGLSREDPDDNTKCIFTPEPDSNKQTATASIMFFTLPFNSKMYTFCDSRYELPNGEMNSPLDEVLHDADIDHSHNQVCYRKSAWEILRDHPDFDPDNAAPIDLEFDFEANLDFQCVQQPSSIRIVLVLDVSGSMDGARIEQMGGDVALFLQSLRFGETEIGMLEFEATARDLVEIIPLDSNANLQRLLDAIPTVANGGTCIGCGLIKALELLEAGGSKAAGGLIMVFTDGEETVEPYIAAVRDNVLQKEPIVHGLLMDGVADDHDLIELAVESGGDFCIYEDSGSGGIDYYQCLMDMISNLGTFAALEVKTEDLQVPSGAGNSVEGTTLIDSSFEDSLRFTLSWTESTFLTQAQAQVLEQPSETNDHEVENKQQYDKQVLMAGCDNVEMVITAPDGTVIDKTDPRYDYQAPFRFITVNASGFPEGVWEYDIVNPSAGVCNARLRIEGFPDMSSPDDEKQPILMTARANKVNVDVQPDASNPVDNIVTVYVTLRQGLSPVVEAEVTADLVAGSYSYQITLSDDGQGADNTAEDGIYSAYFYQYSGDGVYSVRAAAKGISGQTQILRETRELQEDSDAYTVVRTQSRIAVSAFERAAIGGAVEVKTNGVTDMNAIIPPARINDFRRAAMTEDSVQLTWTAVGGSMNDGTALRYDLRVCTNSTQKFNTCQNIEDEELMPGFNLSAPQASGSVETASINLEFLDEPEEGASYYFVIKAVDEYGNEGAESNLAQLQGPVERDDKLSTGAIIGIVVGVIACVGLIGGVVVYQSKKRRNQNVTV